MTEPPDSQQPHLTPSPSTPATAAGCPPSSPDSILENVNAPPIPAPNPPGAQQQQLQPRVVYLRDHVTHVTVYPIKSTNQLAASIVATLQSEINQEIVRGESLPFEEEMSYDKFVNFWFGTFAAVMLLGKPQDHGELTAERDWTALIAGTFYIKPNYPGEFVVRRAEKRQIVAKVAWYRKTKKKKKVGVRTSAAAGSSLCRLLVEEAAASSWEKRTWTMLQNLLVFHCCPAFLILFFKKACYTVLMNAFFLNPF